MKKFAVIFDLDGTIVDNAIYHKRAWGKFCAAHKIPFNEELFNIVLFGKTNQQVLPELFNKNLTPEEIKKYSRQKEVIYRGLFQPEMKPVSGLIQFLNELQKAGIGMAVATSAPPANIDLVLNGLSLKSCFDLIVDNTMVSKGKPDPEIYQKTASLLGKKPSECVVFEDSISGTKSAFDAGCKVIALTTTTQASEHKYYHKIINDFRDISVNFIIQELNNYLNET